MVDKKKKAKEQKPAYHATVLLNTTKAPFQISGAFIAANERQVKIRGEVGDDIGKTIIIPIHMVKVVYLTEDA